MRSASARPPGGTQSERRNRLLCCAMRGRVALLRGVYAQAVGQTATDRCARQASTTIRRGRCNRCREADGITRSGLTSLTHLCRIMTQPAPAIVRRSQGESSHSRHAWPIIGPNFSWSSFADVRRDPHPVAEPKQPLTDICEKPQETPRILGSNRLRDGCR